MVTFKIFLLHYISVETELPLQQQNFEEIISPDNFGIFKWG